VESDFVKLTIPASVAVWPPVGASVVGRLGGFGALTIINISISYSGAIDLHCAVWTKPSTRIATKIDYCKFELYSKFVFPYQACFYKEDKIQPCRDKVLVYNPYNNLIIRYLNDIDNYTVVENLQDVDPDRI
jgi:hypothetical protein